MGQVGNTHIPREYCCARACVSQHSSSYVPGRPLVLFVNWQEATELMKKGVALNDPLQYCPNLPL